MLVFNVKDKLFQIKSDEEFVNVCSSENHNIEYKGHIYEVDSFSNTVTHISGNTDEGAMYYGYSYLYEIKRILTAKEVPLLKVVGY